jgi:hypothetical protein
MTVLSNKAHAPQLISTLAALIVEPPRADAASEARTAARLHGVLGEGRGRGKGLAVCGAWFTLHGATAQTCRLAVTDAQSNLHVTRFNNAETNGRVCEPLQRRVSGGATPTLSAFRQLS